MKKHPLLAAGAAAGTAVLGAAYAVYRVAFYQKPTTKVPSPADMPTRECYSKAMGPDADALARDMFKAVHITAQDGTPLAARYYHHADGAPLAIIFHGYRGYAERDGLGGYTLCTALGYNVLLPDQRAHGYSGGHTITMGVKERYDARDWTVWARSRFGPEVPIFLMGVSMGAATVLLARHTGIQLQSVPFKGGSEVLQAFVGGHVQGVIDGGWAQNVRQGKGRKDRRASQFPQGGFFHPELVHRKVLESGLECG